MIIDTAKLRISTKSIVAAFMSFGALMQVPEVNSLVLSLTERHKRLVAIVTAVGGIYTVLHDPKVQDALGIKHTTEVIDKMEEVSIAPEPTK